MFKRLSAAAFVFGLLAAAPPAIAQSGAPALDAQARSGGLVCAPRDAIIDRLEKRHSERRQARGLAGTTGLLEIWASPENGSWTVLMTRPDGVACVIASGDHWLDESALMVAGEPA